MWYQRSLLALVAAFLLFAPPGYAHDGNDSYNITNPMFCVIVRTYWGHGSHGGHALHKLLTSLQQQTHGRWDSVCCSKVKPFM